MNIHENNFALTISRNLFSRVVDSMSDSFTDTDFAEDFARTVNGHVCRDFGWVGVREGECYKRTVVVWNPSPFRVKHICLVSGRNYSFDIENVHTEDPDKLGEMILGVWNSRITDVRKKFATMCTIVLIKGEDLSTISVFEEEVSKYFPEEYEWEWDQDDKLVGYLKGTDIEKFTWQPHGSQFTITTNVPENRLKLRIKRPPLLDREEVLTQLKFDPSWIEIVK